MNNVIEKVSSNINQPIFDRVLKQNVSLIAEAGEKFTLENGIYYNETETIICISTNETGKFFKKLIDVTE